MTDALESQKDRLMRFAFIGFLTLSALGMSVILYNVYQGFLILRYGQQAQAVVINKSFQRDADGDLSPTVEYEYQVVGVHGKPERFGGKGTVAQPFYDSLASGSTVTIRYLPSRPSVSSFGDPDISLLIIWAIISPLLLGGTIWAAINCLKRTPSQSS